MDFDYTDEFFALHLAFYLGQMRRGLESKETFVFLDSIDYFSQFTDDKPVT